MNVTWSANSFKFSRLQQRFHLADSEVSAFSISTIRSNSSLVTKTWLSSSALSTVIFFKKIFKWGGTSLQIVNLGFCRLSACRWCDRGRCRERRPPRWTAAAAWWKSKSQNTSGSTWTRCRRGRSWCCPSYCPPSARREWPVTRSSPGSWASNSARPKSVWTWIQRSCSWYFFKKIIYKKNKIIK